MEFKPRLRSDINASPQLHFLGAQFAVGESVVPYLTTHMTISQIARYLKTPEQLPGWIDGTTEIEALYQRQLDYRRVRNQILPYITDASSERPRFFNAITVALVPYRRNRIESFDATDFNAPELEKTNTSFHDATGPLKLGFYAKPDATQPETFSLGEMRWNLDETVAVAIDGQHRLAACQMLSETSGEYNQSTRLCVIFLVPSTFLGYSIGASSEQALLPLLRSVFIDLNKHAKPVKRSRLILLDDTDPHSIAVRRLISTQLSETSASHPVDDDRLPLTLVDWHTDDAKFEGGPYITTVLMLDRIAQILLGNVKPVTDWTNKGSVEKQFQAFKKMGYSPSEDCEERYRKFCDAEEIWQASFSYPVEDLQAMSDAFGVQCAEIVSKVLTEIKPYRDLIDIRNDHRMLSADFTNWYEAYSSDDGTHESHARVRRVEDFLKSRPNPPSIESWKHCLDNDIALLKDKNLFYKVVFQGAIFRALLSLSKRPVLVVQEGEIPSKGTSEHLMVWADCLIRCFNRFASIEPGFFEAKFQFKIGTSRHSFWAGSVLNLDRDAIDFTDQGLQRTALWIEFLGLVWHAKETWTSVSDMTPGLNLSGFLDDVEKEDFQYVKTLRDLRERIRKGNSQNLGSMWRVAQALTSDSYEDEELEKRIEQESLRLFDARADFVWSMIVSDHAEKS